MTLLRAVLLALPLALLGCAETPPPDASPPPLEARPGPLSVTDAEVRAADGTVLLTIDDVPSEISPDGEAAFGAADRFASAARSPDEGWLAVVTAGAAHGAGWLVRSGERDPRPAAFQYGGALELGPWSPDGRYAVFVAEGPGPGRSLSVVDRERLGGTVAAGSLPVRTPDHDARADGGLSYAPLEWEAGRLLFEADGARYRFDPATGEATPAE